MNIIGVSALYHDAACCLMQDGVITAAAQEERFTRIKHDHSIPYHSFKYCLQQGRLDITDIDYLAYYEDPVKKFSRQCWSYNNQLPKEVSRKLKPEVVIQSIREQLGYEGEIIFIDHHLSHAASAYYFSGFDSSAILTIDGVGEWATMTYGTADISGINIFKEVFFPHSIGLLYSTITNFLGFEVNEGEYKVMGLAPYGKLTYVDKLRKLIVTSQEDAFELNLQYFDFLSHDTMFTDKLSELIGHPPRKRNSTLHHYHKDIARSLQFVLEELLLEKAAYLHKSTNEDNLCMAGGVALNCVANGRIRREGSFKNLFIQPAANDSGGALGAAAVVSVQKGCQPSKKPLRKVYYGPSYSTQVIRQALKATSLNYHDYINDTDRLLRVVAKKLSEGKVVGWFSGGMEFGPRALGARSILADPRCSDMRDKINSMVKKRENFRPFAPMVLKEYYQEYFDMKVESPFMLEICQVISTLDLPAITHVDNSARVQTVDDQINPRITHLIEEFYRLTHCPILLNTSFNIKGEPIVNSPYDAIRCFVNANLDCLVMEDFFIDRDENNTGILEFTVKSYNTIMSSAIKHNTYTFL